MAFLAAQVLLSVGPLARRRRSRCSGRLLVSELAAQLRGRLELPKRSGQLRALPRLGHDAVLRFEVLSFAAAVL